MLTLTIHAFILALTIVLLLFRQEGLFVLVLGLLAALIEIALWSHCGKYCLGATNGCLKIYKNINND
jgi:hypothetical protein